MKWFKSALVGVFALLMLAMLTVYLTPLDVYVPEVEQTLSARLQMPVSVGSLRAAIFPWPHLELRDALIGGQEGIAVRSIMVSPNLSDLLAGQLVMHVELRDGAAYFAPLRKLLEVLSHAPLVEQGPRLGEMWLSGVILLFPEMAVGPLEGKIEFTRTGALQRAWFALDEKKLTAVLTPLQNMGIAFQVRAKEWMSPPPVRLPLDILQLDGVFTGQGIIAQQFSVSSRGMHVAGSGNLNFSNGWKIHASVNQAEIQLDQLMALLGKPVGLSGVLSGKGKLDGKASDWKLLAEELSFVGDLHAVNVKARIAESFGQPLAFDQIQSHVVLGPRQMEMSGLTAVLYGGVLTGGMSIKHDNEMLNGQVSVHEINMSPLVKALTNEVLFSGKLDSEAKFSMSLDRLDRFPENLMLTGNFHLRDGVLSKVDLVQAVSSQSKAEAKGGVTKFDDLTGTINVNASGYHFRAIKISSGSLKADGRVDVAPTLQLNGVLDVDVKGTAGLVSMPVVVSGTLNDPVVRVSSSVWAGAAMGTAILGPGLGTALGVKVGGFLNKLFGSHRDKNDAKEAYPNKGEAK
ncbi:MAG TPA: AsmA-like C-terminal region-containing protein [Gallionella sp.]|nr:AsmA-like C-terminal region-containing protein [Gallionella sp.]